MIPLLLPLIDNSRQIKVFCKLSWLLFTFENDYSDRRTLTGQQILLESEGEMKQKSINQTRSFFYIPDFFLKLYLYYSFIKD